MKIVYTSASKKLFIPEYPMLGFWWMPVVLNGQLYSHYEDYIVAYNSESPEISEFFNDEITNPLTNASLSNLYEINFGIGNNPNNQFQIALDAVPYFSTRRVDLIYIYAVDKFKSDNLPIKEIELIEFKENMSNVMAIIMFDPTSTEFEFNPSIKNLFNLRTPKCSLVNAASDEAITHIDSDTLNLMNPIDSMNDPYHAFIKRSSGEFLVNNLFDSQYIDKNKGHFCYKII